MTLCLKWLKREAVLAQTAFYQAEGATGVADLRGTIDLKNVDGCNRFYKRTEYPQVFGSKFVPNLSIIDLIFNQGPGAWSLLKASAME